MTVTTTTSALPAHHWSGMLYAADLTPRLGVVIVNQRSTDDTIECLESLLRTSLPMRIVVVDSAHDGGSADAIRAWAAGTRPAKPAALAMAALSSPPVRKPVPLVVAAADAIGAAAGTGPVPALTLIQSAGTADLAGRRNLGLRYLLGDPQLAAFWLLSNDTVVTANAPAALLARMAADPLIGMCGTIVRHYFAPDRFEALNGSAFSLLTGRARPLGGEAPATTSFDPAMIADATDFVSGASLAASRDFIERVGLMSEESGPFFAELDWATRNRRLGSAAFAIGFAHGATIYHKAAPIDGPDSDARSRSVFCDYWQTRSRLGHVWRFHRLWWPWHWLLGWGRFLRRLVRRQGARAGAIARAQLGRRLP